MARKKLLTEGEIRQFMKLANLQPAQQQRLSEMGSYGMPAARDDEGGDDVDLDAMADDDPDPMPADDPDPMPEPDAGMDAAEEKMVSLGDFMDILEDTLEQFLDDEAEVTYEDDDAGDELPEVDLDADAGMDLGGGMDPADDEPPGGRDDLYEGQTQDDIVAEVAKRVAARLQAENRKEEMVDVLAERIMQRLTK